MDRGECAGPEACGEFAIDASRKTNHDDDREQAERDQIPGSAVGEELAKREIQQRAENRPFDRPDAADDHREEQ